MHNSYSINLTINLNEDGQSRVSNIGLPGDRYPRIPPYDPFGPGGPYNPNPFEQIGQFHNEFLEETRDSRKGRSVEEISRMAEEFFSKRLSQNFNNIAPLVHKALNQDIYQAIEGVKPTAKVERYLNEIADALYEPEKLSIDNVAISLVQIEEKILRDDYRTKNESEILLTTVAIAKYSLQYWSYNSSTIGKDVTTKVENKILNRYRRIIGVIFWDVIGGLIGTAAAGPLIGGITATAASAAASEEKEERK